jgi:phosphoribosylamine-glycine ligase
MQAQNIRNDGFLETSGGRVTPMSATANSRVEAVKLAYKTVMRVHFKCKHYRRDIIDEAPTSTETDASP